MLAEQVKQRTTEWVAEGRDQGLEQDSSRGARKSAPLLIGSN